MQTIGLGRPCALYAGSCAVNVAGTRAVWCGHAGLPHGIGGGALTFAASPSRFLAPMSMSRVL
jgi:hypothetical protein